MVAPDDAVDRGRRYAGGVEDLSDAMFNGQLPFIGGDAVVDGAGEIFPVFSDAKNWVRLVMDINQFERQRYVRLETGRDDKMTCNLTSYFSLEK